VMQTPLEALLGVVNACQVSPGVVTGGQPTHEDLERFRAAGGSSVVDLRDPMEPRPLDEPAVAAELGLEYINIPVSSGSLTDQTLERVLDVLRSAGKRTIFVHCGSGSRVGGALLPYLMLDLGLNEEDAVGEAMRMGLRSAELLEWGVDYVNRSKG
jgi:protein tyrosine phosphatase (PTP) superfamily phosphohydrolase (DUF442 family)